MESQTVKSDRPENGNGRKEIPNVLFDSNYTLQHSSKRTPCPICSRTKDKDCSFTPDNKRVLCHTYSKEPPPSVINGYKFTGKYCPSGVHPEPDSAAIYVKEESQQKPDRAPGETIFTYVDGDGNEIIRVKRTDKRNAKKQFAQMSKTDRGWLPVVPDAIRNQIHLYRIFEPLNQQAKANGGAILLVEGEGKVDLLMRMGIAATCNLAGAGKWRKYGYPNYLSDLEGASVVICPDRDKPGMSHAEDIAKDFPNAQWLYPFPDSPEWNELPRSGGLDVYDWIHQGQLKPSDVLAAIGPRRTAAAEAGPLTTATEYSPRLVIDNNLLESRLADRLRYNTLFNQVELDGTEFDLAAAKLTLTLDHNLPLRTSREDVAGMVLRIAKRDSYSPVVDYLNRVSRQYGNDSSILDKLAARYLGTDEPLHQTMLRKFVIQAVTRAYEPGCKADYVLVLQGKEGYRKSTFLKTLASQDWFDDSMGRMSDADEARKLHCTWILEWAEIETILTQKGDSKAKSFITTTIDKVRPVWGASVQPLKRQSVFTGSTNELQFLNKGTGNRRFWVVPVTCKIDTDRLLEERDQIWAAAVALYQVGEVGWLSEADEEAMVEDREQFETVDPWLEPIEDYLQGREYIRPTDILTEALQMPKAAQTPAATRRVGKILTQLGWVRPDKPDRKNGVVGRYWRNSTFLI
jgi:predicted P-loop ATPase